MNTTVKRAARFISILALISTIVPVSQAYAQGEASSLTVSSLSGGLFESRAVSSGNASAEAYVKNVFQADGANSHVRIDIRTTSDGIKKSSLNSNTVTGTRSVVVRKAASSADGATAGAISTRASRSSNDFPLGNQRFFQSFHEIVALFGRIFTVVPWTP